MTKDQLLREIYRQNPQASKEGLNLSSGGLLKLFNLVWDSAYAYGRKAEQEARKSDAPHDFMAILDSMGVKCHR